MTGRHRYPHGERVEVLRGSALAAEADPVSNGGSEPTDSELDWTSPTVVETWDNVPVALTSAVELPAPAAPLAQEAALTAFLPYETAVTSRDRLRVVSGPFSGTYEINGRPAYWRNPYTGAAPGCVVTLSEKLGG